MSSTLEVVFFIRVIATLAITVSLTAGQAVVCMGWQPSPSARMACCTGEPACPEHLSLSQMAAAHAHGSHHAATQRQADQCCASADEHGSAVAAPSVVLTVPFTPAVNPAGDPLPAFRSPLDTRGARVPLAPTAIPKHLLLSVFLV